MLAKEKYPVVQWCECPNYAGSRISIQWIQQQPAKVLLNFSELLCWDLAALCFHSVKEDDLAKRNLGTSCISWSFFCQAIQENKNHNLLECPTLFLLHRSVLTMQFAAHRRETQQELTDTGLEATAVLRKTENSFWWRQPVWRLISRVRPWTCKLHKLSDIESQSIFLHNKRSIIQFLLFYELHPWARLFAIVEA